MLDNDLILIEVDGDEVVADRHEQLPEHSAAVLAHLIVAGAQGGEVEGVTADQIAEALADARKAVHEMFESPWSLPLLRLQAEIADLEPGSEAMCKLAAEFYERGWRDPEKAAPKKRGRPTMASGRFGKTSPGGVRVSGTKLDKAARLVRE